MLLCATAVDLCVIKNFTELHRGGTELHRAKNSVYICVIINFTEFHREGTELHGASKLCGSLRYKTKLEDKYDSINCLKTIVKAVKKQEVKKTVYFLEKYLARKIMLLYLPITI